MPRRAPYAACMRYEIRDILPPNGIKVAMEMQAEAERRKRATVGPGPAREEPGAHPAVIREATPLESSAPTHLLHHTCTWMRNHHPVVLGGP
jgi:hypothetical protein